MKKPAKKYIPAVLFLLILISLISGVFYFYFTGQPVSVSAEEIKAALASQNLEPVDGTVSALEKFPNSGLLDCIVAEQDDILFAFYSFDHVSSAAEVYRQAHTLIVTTRLANPRIEIKYGKVNYRVYTLKANGVYSVAIYVGNTAVYATSNAENERKINRILDEIEYIDAVPAQTSPVWLMAGARLLQFLGYLPMAFIGRHWLWCAAYQSAAVTRKQLNGLKKNRKEQLSWIIDKSPRRKTTKTILAFYKFCLVPEYLSVVLAVVGCFTTQMSNLLNVVGILIPGIIVATCMVGAILSRIFAAKNRKIQSILGLMSGI